MNGPSPCEPGADHSLSARVRDYWNEHIHDLQIATCPVGTPGFFQDLEEYRFDKLRYLPQLVDSPAYRGKTLLEVGCGIGIDLARFATAGATVTGIDLAPTAIDLARRNFSQRELTADLRTMNGEAMQFPDCTFDVVYAHGVLQYTADAHAMVGELHRVLRPGGEAIVMVYNRHSWLSALSKLTKVPLEHQDAPVLRMYSVREFRALLEPFPVVKIVPERFPVRTRLHGGLKGVLFNTMFVGAFQLLPRAVVRQTGWHLMAFAHK
jgi:SAM-dependent methyltransferase